ncbi:hypothetical protein J6590_026071 [Homalodisca vitripennis]|nr:hypothetical protein J6590_026071 [Homalodisca vitripennis]
MMFDILCIASSLLLLDIDIMHYKSCLINCKEIKVHNDSVNEVKCNSNMEHPSEHSKVRNMFQSKIKTSQTHTKTTKKSNFVHSVVNDGKFINKIMLTNNHSSSDLYSKTKHPRNITKKESTKGLQLKKKKKRGKVFLDSQEEILHYKLIDNMMFKPLESNNSVSISFSDDESEITDDDVKQAIEGKDGSYFAIPLKRKKDVYKEFLRWAHRHEQNERRIKIEQEVLEKYQTKLKPSFIPPNSTTFIPRHENIKKNNKAQTRSHTIQKQKLNYETKKIGNKLKQPIKTTNFKHVQRNMIQNNSLDNNKRSKKQDFKIESVEFQYDPDFLNKLYNSTKKHNRKENQNKKKLKSEELTREDISADDYSAQENFMLHTQKEAMGRRFYQMFVNKTASDFWDNTTLETTKMLEILLPLGKHLHESLDKLPPNEGKHFMTNLQMYKTELEKFIALVKQDKAETRNDVVDLLEEPYDHVCETKYNDEEVKLMFGWNDEEYGKFDKLMEETREMWFDLQLFHHCYQFVSDSSESVSVSYNCSDAVLLHNNTIHV